MRWVPDGFLGSNIPMIEATIYGIGLGLIVCVAILVWLSWRVAKTESRFGPRRSAHPHLTVIKGGSNAPRQLKPRPRRERRRRAGS